MADDRDQADAVAPTEGEAFLARMPMRDEDGAVREDFITEISAGIESGDAAFLRSLVGELHEADLGDLIEALDHELRPRLIELAGRDFDFSALNEVDDTVREEILEELPPETVAEGVRELESDDAIELLEDLPEESQEEILERIPASERRRSSGACSIPRTPPAGGCRPTSSRCRRTGPSARPSTTCARRRTCRTASTSSTRVDEQRRLRGAVALDALLRARRPVPIAELMDEERRRVLATDDQEEVARLFGKYNLVAAPVVDSDDRLVGVITVDDVVDVIEEEAEEDIRALGGVTHDEELSDTVWTIAKGRFHVAVRQYADRLPLGLS